MTVTWSLMLNFSQQRTCVIPGRYLINMADGRCFCKVVWWWCKFEILFHSRGCHTNWDVEETKCGKESGGYCTRERISEFSWNIDTNPSPTDYVSAMISFTTSMHGVRLTIIAKRSQWERWVNWPHSKERLQVTRANLEGFPLILFNSEEHLINSHLKIRKRDLYTAIHNRWQRIWLPVVSFRAFMWGKLQFFF